MLHDVWAVEAAQMESDGLEYGGVFAQWKASLIWYVYACLCMGNQVITHDWISIAVPRASCQRARDTSCFTS